MKIYFLLGSLLFFPIRLESSLITYLALLLSLRVLTNFSYFNSWNIFQITNIDFFTYWLLIMLFYSIILTKLAINPNKIYSLNVIKILSVLTLVITLIFITKSILIFYIIFELSVVPIFLILIGWGYQPERQSASFAMFFYTAFCSVPLLIIILIFFQTFGRFNWVNFANIYLITINFNKSIILSVIILLAFIVKLPIFGLHMWLPKAHVEAPVGGSIILAAVLLKLAGLGALRILQTYSNNGLVLFRLIAVVSIVSVGALCSNLFDIKIIIAYSSVAHISLVLFVMVQRLKISTVVALFIIITHAFASSSLFFGVTKIYEIRNRRRVIFNRGIGVSSPKFNLFWLFTIIARMATPPLTNFYSELICFYFILNTINTASYFFILLAIFLAGVYSLILYGSSQHRNLKKFFISQYPIFSKDLLVITAHSWLFIAPLLILVIFLI